MRIDIKGEFWNIAAGAVMGAGISAAIEVGFQAFEYVITSGTSKFDAKSIAIAAVSGGISGALTATGLPANCQMVGNIVLSGGAELYTQIDNGNRDVSDIIVKVAVSATIGGITGRDDGVRVSGKAYGTSINNMKAAKAKHKAARTLKTKKKVYSATKKYKDQQKKVTKSTSKTYAKGSAIATFVGRLIKWLGF